VVDAAVDPLELADEVLSSEAKAASWLLVFATNGKGVVWEGIPDRDPEFLPRLWRLLDIGPGATVDVWMRDSPESRRRQLSPTMWKVGRTMLKFGPRMPKGEALELSDPGQDWILTPASK
jgi:hypothetical protein